MKTARVSDKVVVGAQPSADDLAKLREQGITTVVTLRIEGEANQLLSPSEEATLAEHIGLSYDHVPISHRPLSRGERGRLRKFDLQNGCGRLSRRRPATSNLHRARDPKTQSGLTGLIGRLRASGLAGER